MWNVILNIVWIYVLVMLFCDYQLYLKNSGKAKLIKSISSSFYKFLSSLYLTSDTQFYNAMDDSFDFLIKFLKIFFKYFFNHHSDNYLKMYACLVCRKENKFLSDELDESCQTTYRLFIFILLQLGTHGKIVNQPLADQFSQEFERFCSLVDSTESLSGHI